jgi:WD40 repeat protein
MWVCGMANGYGVARWEAGSGKELPALTGPVSGLESLAFSPDGKTLVGVGDHHYQSQGQVTWWDWRTGRCARTLRAKPSIPTSVGYSPDGRYLAWGGMPQTADLRAPGQVEVWDQQKLKVVRTILAPEMNGDALTFSPDGTRVAIYGFSKSVYLYQTQSGKLVRRLPDAKVQNSPLKVLFMPGGNRVITVRHVSLNPPITWPLFVLWDTQTGKKLREFGTGLNPGLQ